MILKLFFHTEEWRGWSQFWYANHLMPALPRRFRFYKHNTMQGTHGNWMPCTCTIQRECLISSRYPQDCLAVKLPILYGGAFWIVRWQEFLKTLSEGQISSVLHQWPFFHHRAGRWRQWDVQFHFQFTEGHPYDIATQSSGQFKRGAMFKKRNWSTTKTFRILGYIVIIHVTHWWPQFCNLWVLYLIWY